MKNHNDVEPKILLDLEHQKARFDLKAKQYAEMLNCEPNHQNAAYKAEVLLRHATEILQLSQRYIDLHFHLQYAHLTKAHKISFKHPEECE